MFVELCVYILSFAASEVKSRLGMVVFQKKSVWEKKTWWITLLFVFSQINLTPSLLGNSRAKDFPNNHEAQTIY